MTGSERGVDRSSEHDDKYRQLLLKITKSGKEKCGQSVPREGKEKSYSRISLSGRSDN